MKHYVNLSSAAGRSSEEALSMSEKIGIRIIKGPVVPGQVSKPWESNMFRPIYSVYLDSGLVVTNPDGFPPEEVIKERAEAQDKCKSDF